MRRRRHRYALTLNVNGRPYVLALEPRVRLLDALREYIGLTATKKGCDRGQCGACTVLVTAARFGWAKRPDKPRAMRDGHALIGWGMATAAYPAWRCPRSALTSSSATRSCRPRASRADRPPWRASRRP